MVSLGIFKFPLILVIKKRKCSPVHMARLPIDECLSACAMNQALFKGGIVLGHKISKNEIEVDRAKVEVIDKLPHPTTVKGAVLGQRHEKHFKPLHYASKTMNDAETNYTTTEQEMLVVVYAFEKFRSYMIMNKSIVHTDHSALKYLFAKKDAKARLLRFFNEVEFVVNLDFIQRYSKSFLGHTFLQIRDVKRTMNSVQLLLEFKSIGNGSYFSYELKRSNITRVHLFGFAKMYDPFPWRHFQHDLISHLKLKGFSSYIGIALLTITGGLDTTLDLKNLLGCLMDDLWASELTISNFSPAD
nr:DNA-directed DNA polymerase [Tanacetum cinerariifolium]